MLPPLGLVSWCNPWVAGVAALPGLGLGAFGWVTLAAFAPGARSWPLGVALWLVVSTVACDRYAPSVDRGWAGRSTRDGRLSNLEADARYERAVSVVRAAERTDAEVVLLPEGLAGHWTPSTEALWLSEAEASGRVLLVGAIEVREGVRRNGLAIAGEGEARFWSQRLPAPIGMWAPWRSSHVQSELVRSSIVKIEGKAASMLLCFEQFVSWPALSDRARRSGRGARARKPLVCTRHQPRRRARGDASELGGVDGLVGGGGDQSRKGRTWIGGGLRSA